MELQIIQKKIFELRGHKVMLDFDLADLYETETKYLKRSVKQNIFRFPPDFMFELTKKEWETLRCSFSTLETGRGKYPKYLPYAFTEQGVAMLSSVLKSKKAVDVNISIMRAFVLMRQFSLGYKELSDKIAKLEKKYNRQFTDVYEVLDLLLNEKQIEKQNIEDWKNRKQIGFKK